MQIFQYAPFLKQLLEKYPDLPDFTTLVSPLENYSTASVMPTLRMRRQQFALLAAQKDLSSTWNIQQSLKNLSDFADFCIDTAFKSACLQFDAPDAPLAIIAVGKLGAQELNYSSDVDLMAFYDGDLMEPQKAIKIIRGFISILSDHTAESYVLRTDFRLRPDPAMTPIAISLKGAESYYQSMGRTWERAALIRARPVCGDSIVGQRFMKMIQPFVWRRYLDFAAMDEIHAIKLQLGGDKISLAGHNLKTGAGGIREIEFYAQTQQLIWGGKDINVRARRTDEALNTLEAAGHINNANILKQHYFTLRQHENRLQMLNDQQTHTIPDNETLGNYALFCGYKDSTAMAETLLPVFEEVESIYKKLFDDSETVHKIEPIDGSIQKIVEKWRNGGHRVTKISRAQDLLEELIPAIIEAAQATSEPEQAIINFDTLLSKLSAGVQIFSLLKANPILLRRIVNIMGEAPLLASQLGNHPYLLDSLLLSGAENQLVKPTSEFYEDYLKELSRYVMEARFLTGLKLLKAPQDISSLCKALTNIADNAINFIVPFLLKELDLPADQFWILAMGKQGSREMTINSDLDLIFIYQDVKQAQQYTRICQRIINSLAKPIMGEALYNVDMRLRPSGNQGPIATTLTAFEKYQLNDAWTWEHMALTRARVVYGNAQPVQQIIETVMQVPQDTTTVLSDIASMHEKLCVSKKPRHPWHLKHIPGGMIDLEFIVQALELTNGYIGASKTITEKLIAFDKPDLATAYNFYQSIQSLQRLTIGKANPDEKASDRLKQKLALIGGCENYTALQQKRNDYSALVQDNLFFN